MNFRKEIVILVLVFFSLAGNVFTQTAKKPNYLEATWSPDGKYISFTQSSDGGFNIYKVKADGSDEVKLTSGNKVTMYSSWSPDGKEIVFASGLARGDSYDIFIMNADGTNVRQLTKNVGRNTSPAFSPDGKKIAFHSIRNGVKSQIYIMNRDGSDQQKLSQNVEYGYFNPRWSRNGKQIVATAIINNKGHITILNTDGSGESQIAEGATPIWAKDGKSIFYTARKEEKKDNLFKVSIESKQVSQVCNVVGYSGHLSSDGKKIVYLGPNSVESSLSSNALFLLNLETCNFTMLKG